MKKVDEVYETFSAKSNSYNKSLQWEQSGRREQRRRTEKTQNSSFFNMIIPSFLFVFSLFLCFLLTLSTRL
jgi:hypothetical protein